MATQPTSTEQTTTTIPGYAKPYAQQLLGSVFGGQVGSEFIPGLIGQGYQPYGRQRTAGFSPMQQQAFERYAGMQVSPELGQAASMASMAGQGSGMAGQRYENMATNPYAMGAFMSPYMQNVIQQQKRGAMQDYARQIPGLQAQGIRSGGRGGTREALLQAEAQRNLQGQLQGIEATGRQQAFQQAGQQFGADRAAQMQAAMANQQAGLTSEQANLQALLGTQQLGANQSLQSQQLNQAAQLQARQSGHSLRQRGQFFWAHARFGVAAVHIDLDAHLQGRQVFWALLGQALGDFEAVDAVHPIKVLGHQSGFVALNGADAVPDQWQIAQCRDLVHRFLDVVFAKSGLTCRMGLAHRFRPPCFGDSQQLHTVCVAPCRLASGLNLYPDAGDVVGNGWAHEGEGTKSGDVTQWSAKSTRFKPVQPKAAKISFFSNPQRDTP